MDLPFDAEVDPSGVLATELSITDGSAGTHTAPNRWAVLPMEGWDGDADGRPTELVRRRWERFAESGAGLVWGEATAGASGWEGQPQPTGARYHDGRRHLRLFGICWIPRR